MRCMRKTIEKIRQLRGRQEERTITSTRISFAAKIKKRRSVRIR